jgi:hypothetical protein
MRADQGVETGGRFRHGRSRRLVEQQHEAADRADLVAVENGKTVLAKAAHNLGVPEYELEQALACHFAELAGLVGHDLRGEA